MRGRQAARAQHGPVSLLFLPGFAHSPPLGALIALSEQPGLVRRLAGGLVRCRPGERLRAAFCNGKSASPPSALSRPVPQPLRPAPCAGGSGARRRGRGPACTAPGPGRVWAGGLCMELNHV